MAAVLAVLLLLGCSDKGSIGTGAVDSGEQQALDSIFDVPTATEKQELLDTYFGKQDLSGVQAQRILRDTLGEAGEQSEVWVIKHQSDVAIHYGAVVFPIGVTDSLPVLLFCHWGDEGVDIGADVASLLKQATAFAKNMVLVVPSFRSEPLSLNDSTWVSTGAPSPWKLDVLDGLRLVSSAESLSVAEGRPIISKGFRRAIGFSRGGGVALLSSLHDSRYDRVVDFFGPTDFYGVFVQEVMKDLMAGDPVNLPGVEFLDSSLVQGLANKTLSLADVRRELLLRSPARFADKLPAIQIQHGSADIVVPVSQAYALEDALKADAPATYENSEVIIHKDAGHTPITVLLGAGDAEDFLTEGITLRRVLSPHLQKSTTWIPVKPFVQE